MEVRGAFSSDGGKSHRELTPLRLIRGVVCLLVLLLTAFMTLVYCGFVSAVLLRLFSIHHSRKVTSFFFGSWLALWPFLFEKINKTKVIFSGEIVPARERVLLIANHRTEVDWMYLWDLALRKGCLGCIKYVLKSSLMKLPVFGWGFHILEFISVERKWEKEQISPSRSVQGVKAYAAEHGLPILNNVLLPKTKGFYACMEDLRGSLDAVYDVTIGYKPRCPSLLDNVFGVNPSEVHVHVRRIALDEIPTSEEEVSAWLTNIFQLKDQLLSDFYLQGHFPNQGTEGDLSTVKCLVNLVALMMLISTFTFLTIFSSAWFKVYVSLVCCYLSSATYFNVRPKPLL
ncbi:1-ACYL-SN-GLYCEROL-3-PHOSPHATE ACYLTRANSFERASE 5-RELATED [Salix koriyanagi]|uniref:1-acylglycerol-3-phosphate O-acyltransferase n=1 Tax=Salix koriyanagi TaxID=2511006 RepID=A0A9Q0TRZ7_9ROSI|nr:1-ACYL-SN-GLYCEROL-3-PHOSPHATE ACYLTRANSFERASE 5-RELATED [Salix koriyanagi]